MEGVYSSSSLEQPFGAEWRVLPEVCRWEPRPIRMESLLLGRRRDPRVSEQSKHVSLVQGCDESPAVPRVRSRDSVYPAKGGWRRERRACPLRVADGRRSGASPRSPSPGRTPPTLDGVVSPFLDCVTSCAEGKATARMSILVLDTIMGIGITFSPRAQTRVPRESPSTRRAWTGEAYLQSGRPGAIDPPRTTDVPGFLVARGGMVGIDNRPWSCCRGCWSSGCSRARTASTL